MKTAYHAAVELLESKQDFAVARILDTTGSAPRHGGAWMLVTRGGNFFGTVGGGLVEHEVEKELKKALETKTSKTVEFKLNASVKDGLDMNCGGNATVQIDYVAPGDKGDFLEQFRPTCKAVIFGGGHVGCALEPVLRHIGFQTTVADDRAEFITRERFPGAGRLVLLDGYTDPYREIETDEDTYIIIVTRGHRGDYDVLKASLNKPYRYLGMIGSRTKVAIAMQKLEQEGFTKEQIDSVHSPIGLRELGAATPEEISISIAAEIIAVKAGKRK